MLLPLDTQVHSSRNASIWLFVEIFALAFKTFKK